MQENTENKDLEFVGEDPGLEEESVQEENPEEKTTRKLKKKHDRKDSEIEELKLKNSELNDRFLRLYSEFDNYRKRTIKEKLELLKNATEEMIKDLLPVVDDFERAIGSFKTDENPESIKEGVLLIYNKLMSLLRAKGLEPIDAMGKEFNTDFHEAITQVPVEDENNKDKVVDVVERGYTLNEKVIRYAKVVVGN